MKAFFFCFVLAGATAYQAVGQSAASGLDNDATFWKSLMTIRYPDAARTSAEEVKVYVDFTIDPAGNITNVNLLKTGSLPASYAEEVDRVMAQLPAQQRAYAGDYVLPIVFEAKGNSTSYRSTKAERAAFGRTFVQLRHTKSVLNELVVAAN